jgi:hypothetical protein
MFTTKTDLAFYQSKRLPVWAQNLERRELTAPALIDCVVNSHADVRVTAGELVACNLLSIVRSYRRRRLNLAHELRKIAANPGCVINPEKRAAFARRWLRRLGAA